MRHYAGSYFLGAWMVEAWMHRGLGFMLASLVIQFAALWAFARVMREDKP